MYLPAVLVLTLTSSIAFAQAPTDPSCRLSIERPISFQSATSQDRVTVAIGPGPCHLATLKLMIRTNNGKVLYAYKAPFKQHVAVQWDDSELPTLARQFATEAAEKGLVAKTDLPKPVSRKQLTDENPFELIVSKQTYLRFLDTGQPIFHHATYYEGGRFLAYDPEAKKAVIVIQWGL
jgi:hypothetical protein